MKEFVKNYFQLPFLVSIAVLLAFAGGINHIKAQRGVTLIKKALPLKEPFDNLDEQLLAPYKVIGKSKIENQDVIESLGTEDYLQWHLEDTSVDTMSPVRNCMIFITYYTGNPDQVPHVPEACYTGGGHQVKEKVSLELDVGDINIPGVDKNLKIPATGLLFSKKTTEIWEASFTFPVIYFFKVNGQYAGNRTSTRIALGDLVSEYSYFSKIEIQFSNLRGFYPEMEEAQKAAEKVLRVLLPVLEKNHWPDWNTANK